MLASRYYAQGCNLTPSQNVQDYFQQLALSEYVQLGLLFAHSRKSPPPPRSPQQQYCRVYQTSANKPKNYVRKSRPK